MTTKRIVIRVVRGGDNPGRTILARSPETHHPASFRRQLNPRGASETELKKRTLTNLYNQRPTWLDLAHRKLDEAVFAAYGWPANLSDEVIL